MLSTFTAAQFVNPANWQGVDEEPNPESKNFVESGGVYKKTFIFLPVAPSESKSATYLNGTGAEASGGAGKVIVYNIEPNKEYSLESNVYKISSSANWYVSAGLYTTVNGSDKLISLLKYTNAATGTINRININTSGLSDITKLKICVTADFNPILNVKCESNSHKDELTSLVSPTSIAYSSNMRTNGSVESNSASNIYTFPASPGMVYLIYANPVAYTSAYIFLGLCKDDAVATVVSACNGQNYPKTRWCVATGSLDINSLKIVSYSNPIVLEYKKTDYTDLADFVGDLPISRVTGNIPLDRIESNAILSTNGYYEVLSVDSENADSAINYSDGSISTSSTYMKAGVVQHFILQEDTMLKVHFVCPPFTSAYIAACLLKNNVVIKKYIRLDGTSKEINFVIDNREFGADTLLLSVSKSDKANTIVSTSAEFVEPESSGNLPSASTVIENPTKVYTLEQERGKFGVIQRLFNEGIAKSNNKSLRIDGAQNVIIDYGKQYNFHNQEYVRYVNVSADGCNDYTLGIPVRESTPDKLKNQATRIMCIGDSLTDNGYPALVEFICKCLNQDYCTGSDEIRATMVGTRRENLNIVLGNYTFNGCAGNNEGRSGWAICDYLRHHNIVTADKLNWDLLGLGTMTRNGVAGRAYVSFDSSNPEHLALLASTCHGWYDVENTEDVFNYLTNGSIYHLTTFEYNGTTYTFGSTYSASEYATMVAAFKYILSGDAWIPNVFYDYSTVQSSNGEYAFNISAYLDKYKTLENDGVTRLVVGSTAGTLVTNDYINCYDVCVPSHVVIIMSENYQRYGSNITASDVVDDIEKIADLIYQFNSSIKIAVGCTRKYGAINAAQYEFYPGNFSFDQYLFNVWSEVKTRFENSNYYRLPLYAIQSVLGSGGGISFDALDQKERAKMIGDYTHTGDNVVSYLDRAMLVTAWVASTY
jgi:hypothetical protein